MLISSLKKFYIIAISINTLVCTVGSTILDVPQIDEAYNTLKIWEQNIVYSDLPNDVQNYIDSLQTDTPKTGTCLKFSRFSINKIISSFKAILQTKLDLRITKPNRYRTQYVRQIDNSEDEEEADPYSTWINSGQNQFFHLTLNYDGGENAKQPGNCLLRQSGAHKYEYISLSGLGYSEDDYNYLKDDFEQRSLLLALEVARRKVFDPGRQVDKDEHRDLPIFYATQMALQLMDYDKIDESEFWIKGKWFHIYTGPKLDREIGIKRILFEYLKSFEIENLNELMSIIKSKNKDKW